MEEHRKIIYEFLPRKPADGGPLRPFSRRRFQAALFFRTRLGP
jgi:hypothetical protein